MFHDKQEDHDETVQSEVEVTWRRQKTMLIQAATGACGAVRICRGK